MKNIIRKTRRPNGEGCIYYTNGYWCCKRWVKENEVKKRKTIYAKTKLELMQKYISIFGDINKEQIYDYDFCEFMLYWLLHVKKISVSSSTLESNISLFNKHIKPYFRDKTISVIRSDFLIGFFNKLIEKEISMNIFNKCKFLLSQFFSFLKLKDSNFNFPFILQKIKYSKRNFVMPKYKALTPELRKQFVLALESDKELKVVCYLGLYAGMRIGEILALTWDNVDLVNNIINVRQSLSRTMKFDSMGKVIKREKIISFTKTECSVRNIPIPDILHDVLDQWKRERFLIAQIKCLEEIVYVIGDDKIKSYSAIKKRFVHFLSKNNFDKYNIHFHSMRHTYATSLLEQSINPKIVQFLLGHRSVKTTLEIYNNIENNPTQWISLLNNAFNDKLL